MSLIDNTYFQDDRNGIYIPGIGLNNNANETKFDLFLPRLEKEVLIKALGFELYTNLLANLSDGDKYQDLYEGKTYTKSIGGKDMSVRWNGLINTDKDTFIAYYVYWYWVEQQVTSNTLVGIERNTNENSTNQAPHRKMVDAWNRFYNLYVGNYENSTERSLYQFICDMNEDTPDTYENWVFTLMEDQNHFGI